MKTFIFKALYSSVPVILEYQNGSRSKSLNCTHFQRSKNKMWFTLKKTRYFYFKEECLKNTMLKLEMDLVSFGQNNCFEHTCLSASSPRLVSSVCPVSSLPQIEMPLCFLGRPEGAEAWRVNPIHQTKLIPIMRKETEEHSSSLK